MHLLVTTSRIDYCNSLFYGLPQYTIQRLQKIQNKAARIVTRSKQDLHITPILFELHWLPLKFRIIFKVSCMIYKAIKSTAPEYLTSLIELHQPNRPLRSQKSIQLKRIIPKTQFSSRAFRFCAPVIWNNLSIDTRNSSCLGTFKTRLKTELFTLAFSDLS